MWEQILNATVKKNNQHASNKQIEGLIENSKAILNVMVDPIFLTDKQLKIKFVNQRALDLMGYSRSEVIDKMTCAQFIQTTNCRTTSCAVTDAIKQKRPVISVTQGKKKDGTVIDIREGCSVIYGEDGDIIGGYRLIQDISKERQMSRSLLEMAQLLSSSAEQLSSASEEVNASIDQTASTIQSISQGATTTSMQSNKVIEESSKAAEAAQRGKEAADQVNLKMQDIQKTTKTGAQGISSLGEKSKEIGNIINTINQISEQTNLLALNAAIEAARAGDAGRGFAVVADEVRKLAEESGQATQQIGGLINTIQEEIDRSVSSMKENTVMVEEGSSGVTEAVKSFDELPPIIELVNTAANEVAHVAQENAASSEQASSAIEQVSSSMQEVNSSAQSLADLANKLAQLAEQMKSY